MGKWKYPRYSPTKPGEFRSGLEEKVATELKIQGISFGYEIIKVPFVKPVSTHKYLIDFVLPNGIAIETKGIFDSADRKKHLLVKEQHPELDLRFVFSNSKSRLSKQSKTTYGKWCDQHGFIYSDRSIPQAWLDEPTIRGSLQLLKSLKNTQKYNGGKRYDASKHNAAKGFHKGTSGNR